MTRHDLNTQRPPDPPWPEPASGVWEPDESYDTSGDSAGIAAVCFVLAAILVAVAVVWELVAGGGA